MVPLLLILACIGAMWYFYSAYTGGDKTAMAVSGAYEDSLSTEALMLRREYTVKADTAGFFQNNVPSGSKVGKSQNLGWFYKGTPDKELINQLNLVNEKLREATLASGTDEFLTNDTVSIDNRIAQYTKTISALSAEGKQSEVNKVRREIDTLLERKKTIAANAKGGKTDTVATLTAQKNALESKLGGQKTDLFAPEAGIFIPSTDGMEETLSPEHIDTLTPQTISELLSRKEYKAAADIYPTPVCKVVDNSQWYIAVVCEQKQALNLTEGKRVNVRFPDEGNLDVACRITKISDPQDGKVALFLTGTRELYHLYNSRKVHAEIIFAEYSGLQVPANALRKEEGKDVVRVLGSGSASTPKEVEVLYQNQQIAIIKEDNTKKDSLLLYEEVLLQ